MLGRGATGTACLARDVRLGRPGAPRVVEQLTGSLAADFHQRYLPKNPDGYCGVGGTGVSCPIGTGA